MPWTKKISIGISACLLGEAVRYDGGHKRNPFIVEQLSKYFTFKAICPEMEIGLGVPRPPIRLVGTPDTYRALGVDNPQLDVTGQLKQVTHKQVQNLGEISGYILKKDSPSCGMERVKIYPPNGGPGLRRGTGVYTRSLIQQFPLLPLEEEGRLNDAILCENFINRIYIYHHWQQLYRDGLTPAKLIAFHAIHKYLVMAHSQAAYKRMGQLLSNLKGEKINQIAECYFTELMTACKRPINRKRHVNVLQHIMGYLKKSISAQDKTELADCIEAYRLGETPLVVPITLLKHYFRVHPDDYILKQVYLQPHPDTLGLRNQL